MSDSEGTGRWRRERLARARLYLCTGLRPDLPTFLDEVMAAGVDVVQLREKRAAPADLEGAGRVFQQAAQRHDGLFIVNDDARLCVALEADGVHVGQDDMPPSEAREVVGGERLVGYSTHGIEEIDRALGEDCDYLGVGPVHATPTKEGRLPIGLEPVRHAAHVSDRPFFVTGAMSTVTAPETLAAGAHGLVVVRAITEAADPGEVVRQLVRLLASDDLSGEVGDVG